MNFLDLFSGIGGFALGAEMAGMKFENHYYSEVDEYAQKVYRLRFPGSVGLGDIKEINFEEIKRDQPGPWLIAGGFPCQNISIAGKGEGITGPQSGLWSEMFKSIRILRPRYAIIENSGMLPIRGLDRLLANLASIGYNAEWQDIQAKFVGAPHKKRERTYIVAYPDSKPGGLLRERAVETIGSGETLRNANGERRKEFNYAQPDWARHINSKISWGGYEPSPKPTICRMADGIPDRVDRLKCLGNSIVPQIAAMIFKRIMEVEKYES